MLSDKLTFLILHTALLKNVTYSCSGKQQILLEQIYHPNSLQLDFLQFKYLSVCPLFFGDRECQVSD